MEIEIEREFVGRIAADEMQRMRDELAADGPLAALASSQARHDARLADAPDARTLACKAGCFWCCYFTIDVRAVEVLSILDAMQATLTVEERERVRREADANAALLAGASDLERMQQNIKCPFLAHGRCTIYRARPQTCRNYHATNAAGCQRSYEHPEDLEIDPEFAPLVYQIGAAHVDGFAIAMREARYDDCVYEFNAALSAALRDPDGARERFARRNAPFPEVEGIEPELEFGDLQQPPTRRD